jgi:uncharacterized Zn-binding protein involved in type VI secretion
MQGPARTNAVADFNRYFIRDGDATTAGGVVKASGTHMPIDGLSVALEGDSINCPACNSVGIIQCVPPIRKVTGHAGKQLSVDGDLCICACPRPPRLIASQKQHNVRFSTPDIAKAPDAVPWFVHAGHKPSDIGFHHDEQFQLLDAQNRPLVNTPYVATLASGRVLSGRTNAQGLTERIYSNTFERIDLHIGTPTLPEMPDA